MYKVYEQIGKDRVLRMVTEDKAQARNYLLYALAHYRNAWMEVEEQSCQLCFLPAASWRLRCRLTNSR